MYNINVELFLSQLGGDLFGDLASGLAGDFYLKLFKNMTSFVSSTTSYFLVYSKLISYLVSKLRV